MGQRCKVDPSEIYQREKSIGIGGVAVQVRVVTKNVSPRTFHQHARSRKIE